MGRLDGKTCLITGAARGQGAAEARLFTSEGAVVWMVDVLDEEGQLLAASVGAEYRHLDVTDEACWQSLVEEIVAEAGGLQVLINNAGIYPLGRMVDTTVDDFNWPGGQISMPPPELRVRSLA